MREDMVNGTFEDLDWGHRDLGAFLGSWMRSDLMGMRMGSLIW